MKPLRRKSERGNAILEFALGFTILWFLFSGVYQIGYSFYVYNVLMTSVADAAELGSVLNYDTVADLPSDGPFKTALKNMVVYGDEVAGTHPLVPNLIPANVNVNVTLDGGGIPRDVTVTIVNYSIDAVFTSFSLNNKPRATTLYYGQFSCSTC